MGKRLLLGLLFGAMLLLCACKAVPPVEVPQTEATVTTPSTTEPPETIVPAHAEFYLPEYSTQQITEYFNEVVLNMEYTDGTGDATLVQKWLTPICYRIYGTPTDEDLAVLDALFAQLNQVSGFPGIYAAADGVPENLSLNFLEPSAFFAEFAEIVGGEDAYGATQFWYYTATNEIHTARIGYRTDLDQVTRNSILLEEIVNTLGISDTELRTDSIVYQHSNENTVLSHVDWVILKLLYDPAIQCGMNADSCSAIIQQLYY